MGLPCGDNEALGQLTSLADELKAKLAEGKAALGDLSSLQDQITEKLGELKMPELEIPASSLQEDLQALSTKFGQEFSDAQTELREKWGDFVDDIEDKIASIPSLDQILSGEASLPNLCETVENLEIQTTVDEEGNEVQELVQKAAPGATPNVNSEPIPDFSSAMNQAFSGLSSSGSGESFISASINYGTEVEFPVSSIFGTYFTPARERLDGLRATWKQTSEWRSIQALARESGLTYSELVEQGLLTSDQERVNQLRLGYAGFVAENNRISAAAQDITLAHKKLIVGIINQEQFDQALAAFKEENANVYNAELLFSMIDEVIAHQESKSDVIISFNRYRAVDAPRAEPSVDVDENTYNFN